MQSLKNALPYVLLVSYMVLSHFRPPQLSDSIIIIALCSLCGFKFFLESKETPDYLTLFAQDLQNKDQQIKNLQTSIGMHNVAQQKKEQMNNAVW
jgi:hypothetical protein